jgi:hypothetical protein
MHFRDFEVEALHLLLGQQFGTDRLEQVLAEAEFVRCEYSGCGYFVTVRHPLLPEPRSVYNEPKVMGTSGDVEAGYLVFIQDHELMLECHTWGAVEVPASFREKQVQVSVYQSWSQG